MAQRFEGRSLDDALSAAASALGLDKDRVKYSVVSEKRGFLGGVKRLVIDVDDAPQHAPPRPLDAESMVVTSPEEDQAVRAASSRPRGRTRGGERAPRAPRSSRRESTVTSGDVEVPEQETRSAFATKVVDWLTELSTHADFELEFRSVETTDNLTVRLYGRDARRFVEREAELLDAVQSLIGKAFRDEPKQIDLDALSYKAGRDAALVADAIRLAEIVRRDGGEQQLPPMPPAERRVVHLAFATDGELTTESRGEGYLKRVTIARRSGGS